MSTETPVEAPEDAALRALAQLASRPDADIPTLQALIDGIPDPLFFKDRQHRWVAFNRAFCAMLGRSREELDTDVADLLVRTIRAIRLLGCRSIVVGVSPASARTLVQAGTDLSSMVTSGTLKQGLSLALARMRD